MWHLQSIPKVAHFYWGNDTVSFLRYQTVYSFRKCNPDWEIKLYYPVEKYRGNNTWNTWEHKNKYIGPNYMESLLNLDINKVQVDFQSIGLKSDMPEVFKSDLFRWYILGKEGGLWSDFDILYFKPMDCLELNKDSNRELNAVLCMNPKTKLNSIGFLMGSPNNRFFIETFESAKVRLNCQSYQSAGSNVLDRYSLDAIVARYPELNIANLSLKAVYPMNPSQNSISLIFKQSSLEYLTENTVGIHWYGGHPDAGVFENSLTQDNIAQFDNVLSRLISQVN